MYVPTCTHVFSCVRMQARSRARALPPLNEKGVVFADRPREILQTLLNSSELHNRQDILHADIRKGQTSIPR
jgi:hypothetical protein